MIDPFAPPPIDPESLLAAFRRVGPGHVNCRCTPEGNRRALAELQDRIRATLDLARRRTALKN